MVTGGYYGSTETVLLNQAAPYFPEPKQSYKEQRSKEEERISKGETEETSNGEEHRGAVESWFLWGTRN